MKNSEFYIIESKNDYLEFIEKDRLANRFANRNFFSKIKYFFFPHPIEYFLKSLRKYEYYSNIKNKNLILLLKLLYVRLKFKKISMKLGFTIPINVFGPGLSIPHYGTIVVSNHAKIGKNCRLHVGVNIGASAGKEYAPILGDNVYIGPGAILFGGITIPNNTTIAANATVNKSINEENCVIAGTPARIVKTDYPEWWVNNQLSL